VQARWRLGLLFVELGILGLGTYIAVGELFPAEVWYASGLLAVVLNPLLLEPWDPRPYDVIGNSLVGGLLIAWSDKDVAGPGWLALLVFLAIAAILAIVALVFGAGRPEPPGFARTARTLSSYATSRRIYSSIFWLSLLESFPVDSRDFWILGVTWAVVVILGSVNWQDQWASMRRGPQPARIEGSGGSRDPAP
jgi:hypothetical protein